MGFLTRRLKKRFEKKQTEVIPASVRMISGCEDAQTSADVSNVSDFQLPDPAGRAGGACTATLLRVCYADHAAPEVTLSFVEVLLHMRTILAQMGFDQIPQLTSSHAFDLNEPFDLVPPDFDGTKRAVLVGINYVGHEQGQLSGCQNDVLNMKEYLMDIHGFEEDNITVLMDDDVHDMPTRDTILAAYQTIVEESEPGDAIFCHYSGHGSKIRDDDRGEEDDGYDETLVPVDYQEAGFIRDDDLYDTLIRPLKPGVTLTCVMDCCHSGTVLDLPFKYKADGAHKGLDIDEDYDFNKLFSKTGVASEDVFDGDDEEDEDDEDEDYVEDEEDEDYVEDEEGEEDEEE